MVLSEVDYKESSKIINVLTEEIGIVGMVARGTKKVRSNLSSVTSKLTYGYFHIEYKENGLSTLIEVDVINNFRNIKAKNNISKEFKVMFDTSDDNDLIIKMLKLKDNVVKDNLGIKAYKVFSKRVRATIFFEKVETEADKALKLAQIEMLKKSIQRRKNLLSNEGYVTKAPQNIVEQERKNLALEEEKLKNLELDNK